jgi:hypothetical protein
MAEKKEIRALYIPLEKQHKLPSFDTLNTDFDIDTIDVECKHLLKEITKKIFERIEIFKKILETILQPDVSILCMQEAEFLTDQDHEMMADLARRLMRLDRTLLLAEIENDDQLYAEFVNEAVKEWPRVKKDLKPIIQHMQLGWSTQQKIKQFQQYLG